MIKKVYCKDCKYAWLTTTADCLATIKKGECKEEYVYGGTLCGGTKGIVSCWDRNKNGKCKYYEKK